jgi:hypothetical protein
VNLSLIFTLPRRDDGRYYIRFLRRDEDGNVTAFDLTDGAGCVITFAAQADAWDAAMRWKREHELLYP